MATTSPEVQAFLQHLTAHPAFADENIVLDPSSPEFAKEVMPRGVHRDLRPEILVKPTQLSQLPPLTELLYNSSNLDFAIRNGGCGSISARHALISLSHLKTMTLDRERGILQVSAGALWKDVADYLSTSAPDWAVVGPRSSYIGVVGATLIGGVSYLSEEFGLVSDPANLLDVQIALADGRWVWASQEEGGGLLWSLRAGRCVFGIITALKLRARKLEIDRVYSAWVLYPMSKIGEVSRAVAKHFATNKDHHLSMTGYITSPKGLFLQSEEPGVAIWLFDRRGVAHAKSERGFKWAFDIEGVQELGGDMTLHQVNTQLVDPGHGRYAHWDVAGLFDNVDEDFFIRAKDWFFGLIDADPKLEEGSFCLLEFCGPAVFGSTKPEETAWPHGKPKHILQLGVGYAAENGHLRSLALEKLSEGFRTIPEKPLGKGDFQPTFYEPSIMDLKEMYKGHYEKLEKVADRYDPKRRFRSLFNLDPNFTWDEKNGAE